MTTNTSHDLNDDAELDTVDDEPTFDTLITPTRSPAADRRDLLLTAKRRLVPIRRAAVQLPRAAPDRTGAVFRLLAQRMHLPLDLWLLYLALEPVISDNDPLDGAMWAHLLSTTGTAPRSPSSISRAWSVLERENLITREGGRPVLLREDRSGEPWTHPGEDRDEIGYLSLPRAYWLRGHSDTLTLPGKAMLLLLLAETNNPKTSKPITHTHANIAKFWNTSESTVKRGLADLNKHELLGVRVDKIPAPRSAHKYTYRHHHWLKNPYSTQARTFARELDAAERESAGVEGTSDATTG